jgi:glycosyltransferase involved in cell wall biosynthesis
MARPMRVCAFGTFDRAFDRNWILLEALEESGAEIVYCHFDLWAKHRHKTSLFPWRWMLLVAKYVVGLISLSVRFARSGRCDVLYVGYMGNVDMLVAYCLNWRRRSTLVFDPCISLFNTLVEDRKVLKPGGFPAAVIRLLDAFPCRLADVVLTDTRQHGAYFANTLGVATEKIHRVFVGAGREWQQARWRPAVGPFTVFFYAKFSPLHGIGAILDAARRLSDDEIHFTIVGGGQLEDEVQDEITRSALPKLTWIRWLERDALIEQMRQCHVSLGIFGTTTKAAMVIPNKVFQALAMGVPVVTRESPAMRELLDERSAVFCAPDDAAALAAAISACKEDFNALQTIGRQGREAFARGASHQVIARQFFEALDAP